ncbi:MAG: N-6 DNA methylase [Pusillimonas sp.]|nr:N-6 DNA methylase [Pusillimonas sp.]
MATKAQAQRFNKTAGEHQKQILNLLRSVSRTRGLSGVFADWIEICAIALARMDQAQFEAREARYLQIIKQYDQTEVESFSKALAHLTLAYEECFAEGDVAFSDILGSLYMMLDMGSNDTGQFFTPYEVSRMMAMIQIEGARELISEKGFVQVMEPAAGAGGMIIAMAHGLHEAGSNYQRTMHATAIDIDARCVHMCFVQLSMLHIPAVVIHGNALSGETWAQWSTPAHIMGAWQVRLANHKHASKSDQGDSTNDQSQVEPERGQIALF